MVTIGHRFSLDNFEEFEKILMLFLGGGGGGGEGYRKLIGCVYKIAMQI